MSEDHCDDSCSWMYGVDPTLTHDKIQRDFDATLFRMKLDCLELRMELYIHERILDFKEGISAFRDAAYAGARAMANLFS